jgi:hypothetical protein
MADAYSFFFSCDKCIRQEGREGQKASTKEKENKKRNNNSKKKKKPRPDLTCWFVSSTLFTTSVDEIIIIITFNFIILH